MDDETRRDEPIAQEPVSDGGVNLPARLVDGLPLTVPILVSPLGPIFPGMISPVPLGDPSRMKLLEQHGPLVGVVARRREGAGEEDNPRFLYEVGCVGRVVHPVKLPDEKLGVVVMAMRRMRVSRYLQADGMLLAEVDYPEDVIRDQREVAALFHRVRQSFNELAVISPEIPEEMSRLLGEVEEPARFADFVAANLGKDLESRQGMLASFELDSRLRAVLLLIEKDLDLATLSAKLREEIRGKIESRQREHFLREQLQAIRRELGEEVDQRELTQQGYSEKIKAAGLPPEAQQRAHQELERLRLLSPEAAEYHVLRNYLDWIVELPWSKLSPEELDVAKAARILDEDHHGLREVKERIVEFLAVRKLRPERHGALLCLVGPPGVGKTSLGRSIARATGRKFHRVSLGGLRDEAEIKGHRRTYVGAMPGKIIQALRRLGTRNPVFVLDELDKLSSDWRGDPASAMLEVLDPAQNQTFEDLYLDLPFDLSQVMFIATANVAAQIPAPLLDRMEVIRLPGYIPREKLAIARDFLLPRQLGEHGLGKEHLRLAPRALAAIVDGYTREAGVRELERMIGRVCRKVAVRVAALPKGRTAAQAVITVENLAEYLGPRRRLREDLQRCACPGVVVGLAWTPFGGELLLFEATAMPGRGNLQLTGKLGEVMGESARIAHSLVRAHAAAFGIPPQLLAERDIHLHVPAGATPKDGPSAGVAMVCALLSLLWAGKGRAARAAVAMTGEITLRGAVLPVGGIKEKLIGAKQGGVRTVVLPRGNEPDVQEIEPEVLRGLKLVFVDSIDEVVAAVIGPLATPVACGPNRRERRTPTGSARATKRAARGR